MSSFWTEIKQRKIVRVTIAYAVVGWLLIEVAAILLPTFQAPDWALRVFSGFIILGFPIALVLAWAYELTPSGIRSTKSVQREERILKFIGWTGKPHAYMETTESEFQVQLDRMTVNVTLGRIESTQPGGLQSLVALPANEYFDEECLLDSGSALGAFVAHHFAGRISTIQGLVQSHLIKEPSESVEKTPGQYAASYGVGKCVLLNQPLGSEYNIALVAVSTQRADIGLRSNPAYIFKAVDSIYRLMANNRFTRLTIPVFGGGHGGVGPDLSLLCMLIAFSELDRRQSGSKLKELNINVFRRSTLDQPMISLEMIGRTLDFMSGFYPR